MGQFIVMVLIVGAFTAYFFDVDAAQRAGKCMVDIWIVTGLVLTVLSPVMEIFHFVRSIVKKGYRIFHRRQV